MTEQEAQDLSNEFELMDREDEEQILADLRGVPVDKFVYRNKRNEWELTFAGTKWVVRKMAELGEAIRIEGHPKVERCQIDPEYLTVTVLGKRIKVDREAKCETLLDMTVGSARQWIKQKINNGATIVPDEHFFTKCVSRATRNMQQAMIPYDFKKDMIQELVKLQGANGGGGRGAQGAPPAGGQRTQGQQQRSQGQPTPPAGQGGAASGHAAPGPGGATQQKAAGSAQGASQQKPQGQQQRSQGAAKPQGQQKPQDPSSASIEVVQQGFNAVLQAAVGTNDKPTIQRALQALTGKTQVTELDREVMTELGPILRRLAKKELKWTGKAIIEPQGGTQVWPKAPPPPPPEPETTLGGPEGVSGPSGDEIPMF